MRSSVHAHDRTHSDLVLVDRIAAGDASAFEELVRRHGGQMLRTARYLLKHEADAQDVVQEAFLAVHRHIRTFEGNAPLIAWLRRIVINQALMKLRCRKRLREEYIDDTSRASMSPVLIFILRRRGKSARSLVWHARRLAAS